MCEEEEDERKKKRIEMNDKRFTSNTFNTAAAAAAAAVGTVHLMGKWWWTARGPGPGERMKRESRHVSLCALVFIVALSLSLHRRTASRTVPCPALLSSAVPLFILFLFYFFFFVYRVSDCALLQAWDLFLFFSRHRLDSFFSLLLLLP